MCCNSGGVCHETWGTDKEFPEAIVEDWGEYNPRQDAR